MQIIGLNVSPRNLWDDFTNTRPYNGRNRKEFTEQVLNPNLKAINDIKNTPFKDAIMKVTNASNQESIFQVLDSKLQWEKALNVVNGTGTVIGFDTETLGNVAEQIAKYDGYASITEFGIVKRVYQDGVESLSDKAVASFAMGVNQEQASALYKLIERFNNGEWDAFNNSEKSTLERLSKIGYHKNFHDVFVSRQTAFTGDDLLWTVNKLGPSNMNSENMKRGVNHLNKLYNRGAKPEDIIPRLTNIIANSYGDNSVLSAANVKFDIDALEQTSKRLNINTGINFKDIHKNTLDITNAVRTMAETNGESVLYFTDRLHEVIPSDTDRAASMSSIIESLKMDATQTHLSGEDIENQLDVLSTKYYAENKSFIESLMESMEGGIKSYDIDLDKSVFLINRGYIDKSKSDMAVIAGNATPQSYSMGNEYWKLDTSKTGMTQVIDGNTGETSNKFILSFVNSYDNDITVHKEFDNADNAIDFLRKNTTWLDENSLTKKQISEQHFQSIIDEGRREFDKFLDSLSVRKNGDEIAYGFDGLKKYLNIVDGLETNGRTDAKYIMTKIQGLENSPFESIYQEQAFAGMYQRLTEERKVLDYIVKEVETAVGESADPMTKTLALQKAYNSAQDYLTSQYIAYTPKEAYYGISDVFGIDVKVGDSIKRINAQSVSSATSGINNIFRGMSATEAEDIIKGLGARGLLSENQVEKLSHSIYLSFRPNAGINQFVTDVTHELVGITDRFNLSSNPIDEFRQILADGSDARIAAKNLQSVANNLQIGTTSRFKAKNGKNFYTMSYLFDNRNAVEEAIKQRVKSSLTDTPSMSMYDGVVGDDVINALANKLNLDGNEKTLVEEMFSKHWDKDGKQIFDSYAISSPDNVKKGLQSFVVMSDNNPNAFVVLTNSKHSNNVANILSELDDNINYSKMTEALDGHASVLELHGLNKRDLGSKLDDNVSAIFGTDNATLVTANQGKNYEKFLVPVFEEYTDKETGLIRASIKTGGEDLYSSYRLSGRRVVESVLNGDFEKGTTLMRRTQNAKFKDLSAPSSYRGYMNSFGKVERMANYHPADFLHAYEMNINGVKSLFEKMATQEVDGDYNPIQRMLYAFNEQVQVVNSNNLRTAQGVVNYRTIVQSNQFEEFFTKNLFRDISLDSAMESLKNVPADMGGYSADTFNKSIFQMMQDMIDADKTNSIYHKSVNESFQKLGASINSINQLLPESAVQHGLISFTKPGAFVDAAGLFSTMRPTYYQQNRGMYFSPGEISSEIMNDGYTRLMPSSMTETEYIIRETIGDKIKTPNGDPFVNQQRAIATRFKQIGDADLQIKYLQTEEKLSSLTAEWTTKDWIVSEEKLRKSLEYMRQDMSSVYEGKWFLDPILGNSDFFTTPDAKKIEFNIDAVDRDRTKQTLTRLFEKDIMLDSDTIIAYTKNGAPIFYNGAPGKMSVENFNELLTEGRTYIIPDMASVRDTKLMIGPEKATAHTISMKSFMEYTGITDQEDALRYAHKLFGHIFDDATVAGNIANLKHNGNMAASSVWTAIKLEYQRAGKTDELVKAIQSSENLQRYFADWQLGTGKRDMLIVDNTDVRYLDDAIIALEKEIRNGNFGNKEINENIIKVLDHNNANGLSSVELQRVHMNEHLSNQFKMDQRIEQGIRLRNQKYIDANGSVDGIVHNNNGIIYHEIEVNGKTRIITQDELKTFGNKAVIKESFGRSWDDIYLDQTKAYAMSADIGMSKGFLNDDLGAIRHISDIFSTERAASVRAFNSAVLENQENIAGVIEAVRYYNDPENFVKKNMLTVTIDDFIKNNNIPKSGVSSDDLQNFIFKVDGKYSKWMKELARKQGVNLNERSLNIFFDFGQTVELKVGDKTHKYTGALLPIQNVRTNIEDEQFFVNSQRNIAKFINDVIDDTKKVKKDGKKARRTTKEALSDYIYKTNKELAIMKKDSDIYKAYGRYSLPNAGQFLAQDETPAIIDGMITKEMNKLRAKKLKYEKAIRDGDLTAVRKLQNVNKQINKNLDDLANSIKAGNLSEFTALQNTNLRKASIMEIGGKKYYNNAVALGEQGFKKLGFNFGQAGMDLIYDLEARGKAGYTSHIPGIEKFNIMPNEITDIANKINKLNIDGINITEAELQEKGLMKTLNAKIQKKYKITDEMITTRDLNKAIIEKGAKGIRRREELQSIFDTFSDVSKRYVSEIGLFGEHLRYPSFGGQPAVNVLFDPTIQGEQIRYLNPVFSIHTNVDFDGDTGFLHIKLDGGSIAKTGITDGFDGLYKSYLSGVMKGNDLIAGLIADGEAFKVDDLNDMTAQLANKLKAFKEDEYWDTVEKWAKKNKIHYTGNIKSLDDEAILYAANHSPEMRSAYTRAGFNTLTDSDIIRASMIPAIRKQNIGMISTPNFNLRDTINTFLRDDTLPDKTRKKLSFILSDMSNMSTKDRGLLSLVEQKGIDVKHLIDSYNIAETPKWSLGLNQLFRLEKSTDLNKASGLTNMIKASNHVLFQASEDDVQNIVKRIMSTSYEEYNALIKSSADKKAAKNLLYEKWFRGLYDFSNMDGAAAAFHAGIKTGSMDDWTRQYMNLAIDANYQINGKKVSYGTVLDTFNEAFETAFSDQHLMFDDKTVYLRAGVIGSTDKATDIADRAYIFKGMNSRGKVRFAEVSLDYTDGAKFLKEEIGEKVFDVSSVKRGNRIAVANRLAKDYFSSLSINYRSLKDKPELLNPLKSIKKKQALDDILIHDRLDNFLNIKTNGKDVFGRSTYDEILNLFGGSDEAAIRIKNNITKNVKPVYEYATLSRSNAKPFESLIRELNQNIVNNPQNYANSSIDLLIKDMAIAEIGGKDAYNRAAVRLSEIGDLDLKKFGQSLDFLNASLYDTISEEKRLNDSYEAIRRNMSIINDDYKQPLQDILDTQANTVRTAINNLKTKNAQTSMQIAQDNIYPLFKNTKQMDKYFRWDKVSSQTRVGFGEYINVEFGNLGIEDIKNIKMQANSYTSEALAAMPEMQRHAVQRTKDAINAYEINTRTIKSNMELNRSLVSDDIQAIIDTNKGTLNRILNKTNVDEAAQAVQKEMSKKSTITGTFFDSAKNFAKEHITPKRAGIAIASLAAIGIANNVLHNQSNQSPLTPARRKGGNGAPNTSISPMQEQVPVTQAPMSQKKVVYHDKQSGFNFKVSAKTNSYINDVNNAKLIKMSGGGQSSVYSQADMSGVTDNWLANKFAELT